MAKEFGQTVATYYYHVHPVKIIDVVQCWEGDDPWADPDMFFELWKDGVCLNLGDALYLDDLDHDRIPTWEYVQEYLSIRI